jgi:alkylation response protein AidB-like acyl-CoA dehydrogenase
MFALVRTDAEARKQEGISFLLIDMRSAGVEVRPIRTLEGGHEINEVFLTDVRVPVAHRVGEENRGWDYAKFLLGNERTNIARIGTSKLRIAQIRACETAAQPRFCERLAAIEADLMALEMTQWRVLSADAKRGSTGKPDPASSVLKLKATEIQQALMLLHMQVLGPRAAAIHDGVGFEPNVAARYFNGRKVTIYGGSTEVQKNIIAKTVLGL